MPIRYNFFSERAQRSRAEIREKVEKRGFLFGEGREGAMKSCCFFVRPGCTVHLFAGSCWRVFECVGASSSKWGHISPSICRFAKWVLPHVINWDHSGRPAASGSMAIGDVTSVEAPFEMVLHSRSLFP